MERLNQLVTQFYLSGDPNVRSLLEQEVHQLRSKPQALSHILDQIVSPALCHSHKNIHPQLVFVCLGLVQDFIRQWTRLPPDLHAAIIQTLVNGFHGPMLASAACPTYISSKLIQLLADVALFTWPATCDPINVAVQCLQNSPSPPNPILLRLALNLIHSTSQALSTAQSCKYLLTARGAEVQSQWPQYAIQLEHFIHQTLTTLTIAPPSSSQSLRSPLSPTSLAAGANAYPSPMSPYPSSSSASTPICLDRPSARICLQILQLFTHQLQPSTLSLLHLLGTTLHPMYGKSVPFAVLDTLHAQLVLPRLDQTKFTHVLGAALQVLTDVMTAYQISCPATPAGSDADGGETDGDDVLDDDDDDDGQDSIHGRGGMGQIAGALARKGLRDLGVPIAAQHLLRSTPAQIVQLANALLAALHLPGAPGREARRAVLEVLHAVATMNNKAEHVPLVQQVVQVVAQGLDQVSMRDLEDQDDGMSGHQVHDMLLNDEHVEIDAHPGLSSSRLGQLLALLEGAAEINPMGTLETVFPTLNTCVDYVDRWIKDAANPSSPGPAGRGGPVLSDQVVQAFAVSLRAVSHLAPKCDAVPELAGVPTMVVSKCAEIMSHLAPHAVTSAPGGPSRAMLECVLAVQAMLEAVRIHERNSTSPSPMSSTPSTPSPSPVPPATESTQIVQQLVTSLLAVLSTRGAFLQSPLAIACAGLLASICTTVRPASMALIGPHVVQCTQTIVSSVPDLGFPIVDPAMRAVVACCVYPATDGSLRAGSDEAKVRAMQLRDALSCIASAAGGTSNAMLPILTSVVAAVSMDAHTTKSIVAAAVDQLRWTSPLVAELSQLLASTATNSGPSATEAERINHLTRFFALYVSTFVRSPLAQGLVGALLNYPLLVRGAYPAITPGVHRLLEKLVADGKCFEPYLARFGSVFSTAASSANNGPPPFPASLLRVISRVLIDHWRAFFPSGILSTSEELRHADTLHVLLRVPLMALESTDVELVRAAVLALLGVHDRWRLFHKPLWVSGYRAGAIAVVVRALVKDELMLLQDDLVAVLKGMVAFDSVQEGVFTDSLKCVYEAFVGCLANALAGGMDTGEVGANWDAQVRELVGGQVADKAAFEAAVKALVQDFKCVVNGY